MTRSPPWERATCLRPKTISSVFTAASGPEDFWQGLVWPALSPPRRGAGEELDALLDVDGHLGREADSAPSPGSLGVLGAEALRGRLAGVAGPAYLVP